MASREEIFFIPYGRVLSELFSQEGIFQKVQESSLIDALVTTQGLKLDASKSSDGQRWMSRKNDFGFGPSAHYSFTFLSPLISPLYIFPFLSLPISPLNYLFS